MALQLIFGLIVLRWDFGRRAFECLGSKFSLLLDYSVAGSEFVYGYLANDGNASGITLGTIFAFRVKSIASIFCLEFDFIWFLLKLDFVGHLLFQFSDQPPLLLRCDAVVCPETWMALASFSRYDGRRIDERCVQHLFRTGP